MPKTIVWTLRDVVEQLKMFEMQTEVEEHLLVNNIAYQALKHLAKEEENLAKITNVPLLSVEIRYEVAPDGRGTRSTVI